MFWPAAIIFRVGCHFKKSKLINKTQFAGKRGCDGGQRPPPPQKGGVYIWWFVGICIYKKYECECIYGGNLEKLWGNVCVLFGYMFIIFIYKDVYIYI